ncbi:MAG: DNA polymerase III subunit gamma/tau [Holosporales bacterium]|nr:DNA polymerase III subunit gamma/tau [Holosporales bacterium]
MEQNQNKFRNCIRRVSARKYRPKVLKDIIGQDTMVRSLTQGITEKRIPQAILLHGIRGTGKTSTARILARSVNCIGPDGLGDMTVTPCCACKSCKAIDDDSHVDVIEMDAASHTGVDDIREIIESARYKAVIGHYKVFIIDEVHMLSKSAFNALLKTLEEPPAHVLFVFATTEINKIPETILSRCARFDLKRVESKTLIDHIKCIAEREGYEITPDACALLARSAEGSVRDALTLLDQAMNLTELHSVAEPMNGETGGNDGGGVAAASLPTQKREITVDIIRSMVGLGNRQTIFDILSDIIEQKVEQVVANARLLLENGSEPVMVMQELMESLYHVACFKVLPNLSTDASIPEFERERAAAIARQLDDMQLLSLWKVMLKAYADVKQAPFAGQALEIGLMRVCFAASLPSIEQLLAETGPLPRGEGPANVPSVERSTNASHSSAASINSLGPRSPASQNSLKPSTTVSNSSDSSASSSHVVSETVEAQTDTFPKAPEHGWAREETAAIASVDDLFFALEKHREVLLLSYLRKDTAFVSFTSGNIDIQVKNENAVKIIPLLKKFLHMYTGEHWCVSINNSASQVKTSEENEKDQREKREAEILETTIVSDIKKIFPESKIAFEYDGARENR